MSNFLMYCQCDMELISEILKRHLENVKANVAKQMEANNRNASGRSVASLSVEVIGNVGTLYGSKSFLVMERGRKGGKVPKGFYGIIRQWIIDKGIAVAPIPSKTQRAILSPEERGLRSLAGAIAYNIMKYGTKLHRDGGYNDIYTSAVNDELKLLHAEVVDMTAQSIAQINEEAL